jgi:hypothetical protein
VVLARLLRCRRDRRPGAAWAAVCLCAAAVVLASCYASPAGAISVLRSADGGASWQQVGPDWTRRVLNDIARPAALTCYLAGTRGTIARITNGTTLAAQHSPTVRDLYGIGCASPCACYAVEDNGTILALR